MPRKRPEIRIIAMSQDEYNVAMRQFLGKNFAEEISSYWDHAMSEFEEAYNEGLEIANMDEYGTQYFAVITNAKSGSHDGRLWELPESFDPDTFRFTERLLNHPYYDEDDEEAV